MITPEEYAKKCEEYRDRIWEVEKERAALDARIAELEAERASFREKYVRDALERSGYNVGQQLKDENGKKVSIPLDDRISSPAPGSSSTRSFSISIRSRRTAPCRRPPISPAENPVSLSTDFCHNDLLWIKK